MKRKENVLMTKESKEAKNAYMREWRANHRERVREYTARYWNKKAEQDNTAETAETAETE